MKAITDTNADGNAISKDGVDSATKIIFFISWPTPSTQPPPSALMYIKDLFSLHRSIVCESKCFPLCSVLAMKAVTDMNSNGTALSKDGVDGGATKIIFFIGSIPAKLTDKYFEPVLKVRLRTSWVCAWSFLLLFRFYSVDIALFIPGQAAQFCFMFKFASCACW